MAGALQILNYRYPTAGNGVFRQRNTFLSANHVIFYGRSVSSSPNSSLHQEFRSISQTIRASERSDQANGNGSPHARISTSGKILTLAQPLWKLAMDNFLPLALITGVALGLANPSLGCLADRYSVSKFSTFGIFIISGLTLRSGEIGAAAEAWPAGMFGLV
ncbi:hypothetical protein HHK36_016830 [Tetracentron sinense]|uniref:Uncharacterized protein n=1 Tax=Tetracentron sinense TaxID=13715 RepID=A0A834Z213_TETSI|nr:hypothetical protein HHK36_016830 [Tetracentron sinense]